MKRFKLKLFSVIIFTFLVITTSAFASTSSGTISPTYHYAWGENVGFIDFINIGVTDSSLSGSIYGENIGWIDLSTITNNNEGTLSGHAWGENIGWVDFQGVIINNDGVWTGQAYGENIGFITFNTNDNNKVTTDWRPRSTRSSRSSGGMVRTVINPNLPVTVSCLSGHLFDTNTGKPCTTTPSQITPVITRTLKLTTPRMKGQDVKDLQNYLNNHNYNSGLADGVFGTKTKATVILFQLANKLKGDGVVGPITRALLK